MNNTYAHLQKITVCTCTFRLFIFFSLSAKSNKYLNVILPRGEGGLPHFHTKQIYPHPPLISIYYIVYGLIVCIEEGVPVLFLIFSTVEAFNFIIPMISIYGCHTFLLVITRVWTNTWPNIRIHLL